MNVILANEGDYIFILSLSGKMVKQSSSKAELRKAYLLLSSKVHPDKNPGSQSSKKAFQAVSEAFERLTNPEKSLKIFSNVFSSPGPRCPVSTLRPGSR